MNLKNLTEQRHVTTRIEEVEKLGICTMSTETGGTHSFVALWTKRNRVIPSSRGNCLVCPVAVTPM
jgi:Fe-S cluster biogenesis protein NfuA